MKPLEVIFYPGELAQGRTKARPPRWVISERGGHTSLLEITRGVSNWDCAELYALLDIMAHDFNSLHLRDSSISATTEAIRESLEALYS